MVEEWPDLDLALLKADFPKNSNKAFLEGETGFPFIEAEMKEQEEGTPVYAFGYPLPEPRGPVPIGKGALASHIGLGPRATSAIIASTVYMTQMVMVPGPPKEYVFDKALNYGNSGGPIVLQETGRAFAVCERFQPVQIPQEPSRDPVVIPSLYGVGVSIATIESYLRKILLYLA